jgi:hypothetical protein
MNRRVRNRTPGGVGGGRRKAPSYPMPRAGLSSPDSQCMVGAEAQRRRWRPLFAGRHVPVNEPLGVLGKIVVGVEGRFEHLAGDILGYVSGHDVEGDHAERVRILPAQEIAGPFRPSEF